MQEIKCNCEVNKNLLEAAKDFVSVLRGRYWMNDSAKEEKAMEIEKAIEAATK